MSRRTHSRGAPFLRPTSIMFPESSTAVTSEPAPASGIAIRPVPAPHSTTGPPSRSARASQKGTSWSWVYSRSYRSAKGSYSAKVASLSYVALISVDIIIVVTRWKWRFWMGTVLLIILIVVIVLLVIYAIATYNGLVRRRNETEEAYRQIDVQLKRRYDLIPNLLEGVKKYFRQEQEVLTQITEARSRAMQPQSPRQQAQSEARLSGAIGNLFAVAENYPELRSDRVLLDFQEELSSTENKKIGRASCRERV